MSGSLFFLRVFGGLVGIIFVVLAFMRFRAHLVRRWEFVFVVAIGTGLVAVSFHPSTINVIASMMALESPQYGRLITLLVLSNFLLWILLLGLRGKGLYRDIQFDLLIRKLAQEKFTRGAKADGMADIMVIIPALNEAENLGLVLPRIPKVVYGRKVGALVVDDGSSDNTAAIVEQAGFSVISNPINRGGGAALRLGYDMAAGGKATVVVTMDADGQHLPEEIENLVTPILNGEADIVIGSRVLGTREKDSLVRWIGIHVFNYVINFFAGTQISDCSNGFRAFRVSSLQKVLLVHDQFHTAELIIEAARKGLRIKEAPVSVLRRVHGTSKKGRNWAYGFNFFKSIMSAWFR